MGEGIDITCLKVFVKIIPVKKHPFTIPRKFCDVLFHYRAVNVVLSIYSFILKSLKILDPKSKVNTWYLITFDSAIVCRVHNSSNE